MKVLLLNVLKTGVSPLEKPQIAYSVHFGKKYVEMIQSKPN